MLAFWQSPNGWVQMKKSVLVSITFAIFSGLLFSAPSESADMEWSGTYRIEGVHIKDSELDGRGKELNYGLHHLSLRPKIVAGDGITIYGQFELFTNSAYPNSQLGQVLGDGVGTGTTRTSDTSNTIGSTEKSRELMVSQLYLSWVQEYGALIVGRAPLQFGLGMTYNAGKGLFDHWFDTRDLVGYKILMGNLYFLPMYGKVSEGSLNTNEDVNDFMVQMQYENPETDLEMGVFYRVRKSSDAGSDAGSVTLIGGAGATNSESNFNELSIYALRDTERFRLGVEGSFLSGKVGARTTGLDDVTLNGFGVAGEVEYRPETGRWIYGAKLGTATGDDPDSDSRFEGFVFDRNYEVAMLLFNRPLGRRDVLRTGSYGGGPDANGNIDKPDVEAVSNVLYLAPYAHYKWTDRLRVTTTLATGWLNTDPVPGANEVGKGLGYELDFSLAFTPRKGVQWVNEVGMLFPGSAFDFNSDKPGFAYGFTSKAAVSF